MHILSQLKFKSQRKQDSIQEGCVLPACQLYMLWWPPLGVVTWGGYPRSHVQGIYIPIPLVYPPQKPGIPPLVYPLPYDIPHKHTHSPWTYPLSIPTTWTYPCPLSWKGPGIRHTLRRDLGPGITTRRRDLSIHTPVDRQTPVKTLPSSN